MAQRPNKPLVTVIIPTYNRGWIVGEAIDSVLAQDFSDYELIIVDDGSDDRTPEILAAYGNKIKVLRQDNSGVSAARNRGIAAAAGRLIALLDSDDLWLPQKLSTQVRFFAENPDAVINQTEERWVRNGVRVNPQKRHLKFSGMIFERSLALCLVSPSAVMIKKSLFDTVGVFDEDLPACEDYDLWLRISCRYPVHLTDNELIIKRGGHKDQLSRAPGLDKYRIQSLVKLLADNCLTPQQKQAAMTTLKEKCDIYAGGCQKRGKQEEAKTFYQLADHVKRQMSEDPSSLYPAAPRQIAGRGQRTDD